jgi:hypothetical protein
LECLRLYARSNPLRFTDASGLQADEPPIFRICCGEQPAFPPGMILPQQPGQCGFAAPVRVAAVAAVATTRSHRAAAEVAAAVESSQILEAE